MKADWIAVDWGTSNLRVWVMGPAGEPLAETTSAVGMATLAPGDFEPALIAQIAPCLQDGKSLPVIACGMVGARQGWIEAPYAAAPCKVPGIWDAIRAPVRDPRLDVRVLSGVMQSDPADVMRGEETQIGGFVKDNPGFEGVICLPGTHTKWVQFHDGQIKAFRTFMTGELFGLLSRQSVLRHTVSDSGWDGEVFKKALADALGNPEMLGASLFSLRAEALLRDTPPDMARSRLSGLLVGLELSGARSFWQDNETVIIGDDRLASHYATALETCGALTRREEADTMTLNGLKLAYETLKEARE